MSTDCYRLRREDVRKAMRALNRPSDAGYLFEALRDLLGHAEQIECPDAGTSNAR